MKSENREPARSADAPTPKDLPFQELTTSKFALTVELVRLLKPLEFPPKNRKKSSASFTTITLNKRHTAATLPHVRRFSCSRKVTPHTERWHTGTTVGLLRQGIYYTITSSVFPRYFGKFSRLLLFTLCGILCTTEVENRTENNEKRRKIT